jgi:predicted negative regulator of RcsB-dependent stress response
METEMESHEDKWWNFNRAVFLFVVIVAAFAFSIIGYQSREASQDAKEAAALVAIETQNRLEAVDASRQERVKTLNDINKKQCNEIEALKNQFRIDAIEDFENLDETLRLLNISKTEAIVKRAMDERDQVLDRFKAGTCPREIIR